MSRGKLSLRKKKLLGAVLALLPGLGAWEVSVQAQPPIRMAQAQPQRTHIKSRVFHLPIRMEKSSLSRIREVRLYWKEGQGEWMFKESVAPTTEAFRCQVPRDGEYSFAVVTVDYQGNTYPADLNQTAPVMTVLVETQARDTLLTTGAEPNPGSAVLAPANSTVIMETLGADPLGNANPLPLGGPSAPIPGSGNVRVSTPTTMPQVAQTSPVTSTAIQPQIIQPLAQASSTPAPVAQPTVSPPPTNPIPTPPAPTTLAPTVPAPTTPAPATPAPTTLAPTTSASTAPGQPKVQLMNTARVGIDYNVGKVGPSGLGKVEVWGTQDQGRSWQRLGEDTDNRAPAEVDLPGEGVHGIRLVASNGNGFGGKAPVSGDAPTSTIEVDLTCPTIHSFEIDSINKNGILDLRWRVTDKNLGSECINIYFAAQRSGPWLPLAFKAKNDGVFHWSIPRDVPNQIFLRLETTDLAGNVSRSELPNPLMLDTTEPDVNLTGISAMPQRPVTPTGPAGN